MKYLDSSEIVFGLILSGKINVEHVNPSIFADPYGEAVKLFKNKADISDLYDKVGLAPVKAALEAGQIVDISNPYDLLELLEKAHARETLANTLDREVNKLRRGDDADILKIESAIERSVNMENRYTPLNEITPLEGVWVKTGYQPLDDYVGGVPDSNLTIIAAPPGVGKTSLLAKTAIAFAKTGRKVLFYTLEMTGGQIAKRVIDIEGDTQHEDYKKNIIVSDEILDVDEICADAAKLTALDNYGMIGIDFADLMLTEKEEEGNVAQMYRAMARLAKRSGTPVVLLSQLNRQYAEQGGIPRINNIRWSGLAEAMAALILLIYNPNQIFGTPPSKNQSLVAHPGRAYIIIGKSRFGFKQGGVGAIDLEWDGKLSWGQTAVGWMPLTSV